MKSRDSRSRLAGRQRPASIPRMDSLPSPARRWLVLAAALGTCGAGAPARFQVAAACTPLLSPASRACRTKAAGSLPVRRPRAAGGQHRQLLRLHPQYKSLEALYARYRERAAHWCWAPSTTSGQQEPGTGKEIAEFCETPSASSSRCSPSRASRPRPAPTPTRCSPSSRAAPGQWPRWNFHKYLVARDGSTAVKLRQQGRSAGPRVRHTARALLAAPAWEPSRSVAKRGTRRPQARQKERFVLRAFQPGWTAISGRFSSSSLLLPLRPGAPALFFAPAGCAEPQRSQPLRRK